MFEAEGIFLNVEFNPKINVINKKHKFFNKTVLSLVDLFWQIYEYTWGDIPKRRV